MQLKSGQTIAGNMIWHTGNLNLLDDGSNLFYNRQFKLFQTGSKPDVDKNEVLNAASVNRPTINNELTVNGTTSFNPRVKFTLGQKQAQILYNNQQLNFTTTDGANINFPNVSGTVITTGNYPTWVDVGGENYLVNNNSTEIRPNQKHFVTASSTHNILPFQNNVSQIGLQNRVFNQGHFNTLNQTLLNSTSYQSSYNTGRFITFDNQSGFTHTRISGQNNTKAQDIILGFDDNSLSKTRNIILNKPLLQNNGTVIIDQNGKIDFSILKNNNKVDRAGDTLTGQLLFDGTGSSHIEFKTDNQRSGQIKQSTQIAGSATNNEIKFLNYGGFNFYTNNKLVQGISPGGDLDIFQHSGHIISGQSDMAPARISLHKSGVLKKDLRHDYNNIGRIDFRIFESEYVPLNVASIRAYAEPNKYTLEIGSGYENQHQFKANNLNEVGIGNINPTQGYGLTVKGLSRSTGDINTNQNDYTLATTKWVRSVAINEIDALKRSISDNGVTTTKVTVQDKFEIVNGAKTANLVYENDNLVLNNNRSGNLYYNGRLVFDSTTIPMQQTIIPGIVRLDNTLQSTSTQLALTAAQGKILNDSIQNLNTTISNNYIQNSKKSNAVNSTSQDTVATSNAAKTAYDKGVEALNIAKTKQAPATTLAGYGITDFQVQTKSNNINARDLMFDGIYAFGAGGVNLPTGAQKVLNLAGNDSNWRHQIALRAYSTDMYISSQVSSGSSDWLPWRKVILDIDTTADPTANKLVQRDASGDVHGRLFRSNYVNEGQMSGAIAYRINNSDNNYTRYCSNPAAVRTWLGLHASQIRAADWSEITNKPAQATRWPQFTEISSKPTNLSGYGITDAVTLSTAQTITGAKTFNAVQTFNSRININGHGRTAYFEKPDNDNLDLFGANLYCERHINAAHFHSRAGAYFEGNLDAVDVNIRSDIRYKQDLKKIENALDKINQLNGFTYKIESGITKLEKVDSAGLIAQEVQKVLPEVIKTSDSDGRLRLNYNGVIALIIEAIKELDQRTR